MWNLISNFAEHNPNKTELTNFASLIIWEKLCHTDPTKYDRIVM